MIGSGADRPRGTVRVPGKWRAAVFYLLLTLVLTYPLSLQPHRAVLARYPDDELLMWVLAWDAHAFVHQPLSIFDANIFHPHRHALAFSENLIGNALFAAPVLWVSGNPVLALNVVALLACALCGLGGYVLGCRVGLSVPSALVCGLVFAFSPARFFRTPQIHIATVQWIPFALASLHTYLDGSRGRDLRIAVGFFTLQALATGHGAVFLAFAIVLLVVYRVALGEPVEIARRVRDFGIPGALLLAPSLLVYLPYHAVQDEMGLRRGLDTGAVSPESLLASPTHAHVWLRPFVTSRDVLAEASAFLFVGYLPLALALIGVLWPRRRHARQESGPRVSRRLLIAALLEAATLIVLVVALIVTWEGPVRLRVGSATVLSARSPVRAWLACAFAAALRFAIARQVPLALPRWFRDRCDGLARWLRAHRCSPTAFYFVLAVVCISLVVSQVSGLSRFGLWPLVYRLPAFSFIRAPSRFIVLAVLAIAVLTGIGLERITATLRPKARVPVTAIFGALLIAEFSAIPLKVVPYRIDPPSVDKWVAGQPKPFVCVELPLFDPDQRYQTAYMLHSTLHWQQTVNGYSGIVPKSHEALYKELRNFPDAATIAHLKQLGVTYVIAHTDLYPPPALQRFDERVRTADAALKLEYGDAAGRVFSLR
jgi:hypothetical protein